MEWNGNADKQALVLGGGGSKGSWQAGVLSYVGEHALVPDGFPLVAGTSVGAINGAGVAQFPPEQFKQATEHVEQLWKTRVTKTKKIWKWRQPRYVAGLHKLSLGKTEPLRALLNDVVDIEAIRTSSVDLTMPAVSLLNGELKHFTGKSGQLVGALMASSSFPLYFPPERRDGDLLTDGGVRDVAPLKAVIDKGAEHILVVHTAPPTVEPRKLKNVFHLAKMVIDIMSNEILINDIDRARQINRILAETGGSASYRPIGLKVIGPSEDLGDPLDFSGKLMKRRFDLGRRDAEAAFAG